MVYVKKYIYFIWSWIVLRLVYWLHCAKNFIVGGRLNQTRLEINDGDHFSSKYISTLLWCPHQYYRLGRHWSTLNFKRMFILWWVTKNLESGGGGGGDTSILPYHPPSNRLLQGNLLLGQGAGYLLPQQQGVGHLLYQQQGLSHLLSHQQGAILNQEQ